MKSHRTTGTEWSTGSQPHPALADEHRQTLLRLARLVLGEFLERGTVPECRTDVTALLEPRATFVTLTRRASGELRGCRGECPARRPLVESVARMVVASATDDPRFQPLTAGELPDTRIEISALTPLEPIQPENIVVGRHGLVISSAGSSGLLLPQVPVSQGWDRLAFLDGLCEKAGLPSCDWQRDDISLYGFEAEVWRESE